MPVPPVFLAATGRLAGLRPWQVLALLVILLLVALLGWVLASRARQGRSAGPDRTPVPPRPAVPPAAPPAVPPAVSSTASRPVRPRAAPPSTDPGVRLGIDFGTSNTAAVLDTADGRRQALLFDGSPLLPSSVFAADGGGLLVGRDAAHLARTAPERFEPSPKRCIDESTVLLGVAEYPVVDLMAAVFARVLDEARRTLGGLTPAVTLRAPAKS